MNDTAVLSLKDYFKQLRVHDWTYEYSDDNRVWERGRRERANLRAAMKESPEHEKLYHEFNNFVFHQGPEPKEPE